MLDGISLPCWLLGDAELVEERSDLDPTNGDRAGDSLHASENTVQVLCRHRAEPLWWTNVS